VVEPAAAPCLAESISAGKMVNVEGPVSNMGQLECMRASLLTFESLRYTADGFIEVSESDAGASTVRLDQHGIRSTPSGSTGLAGLMGLLARNHAPASAICLIVMSEGV
jgi:diaminopropionate ammonia-lyase